jgi:hypothetical protein
MDRMMNATGSRSSGAAAHIGMLPVRMLHRPIPTIDRRTTIDPRKYPPMKLTFRPRLPAPA